MSHTLLVLPHSFVGVQLQSPNDQDGQPLQLEPASACTALTASSKLCNLDLAVHAPRNVLQHCFVQGQQLPCLTSLIADGFCSFNRDDLQSVAVCCPSLRSLNLQPPLSWTPAAAEAKGNCDLSPLLQLHHLTQLTLWNVDDAAAGQLARLTELRCLQVLRPSDVTDVGLLRLTALTALEYLSVYQSSPGAALMGPGGFRLNCVLSQVWREGQGGKEAGSEAMEGGREHRGRGGEGRGDRRGKRPGSREWRRRGREGLAAVLHGDSRGV